MCRFVQEEKTVVDKQTIITYLMDEGVAPEQIAEIMQIRCKEKKRIGATTGLDEKEQRHLISLVVISFREEIQ